MALLILLGAIWLGWSIAGPIGAFVALAIALAL